MLARLVIGRSVARGVSTGPKTRVVGNSSVSSPALSKEEKELRQLEIKQRFEELHRRLDIALDGFNFLPLDSTSRW